MPSLKTVLLLLTSVAYFVVFALILFSWVPRESDVVLFADTELIDGLHAIARNLQSSQEAENPENNVESFDTTLQVVAIASANGVFVPRVRCNITG